MMPLLKQCALSISALLAASAVFLPSPIYYAAAAAASAEEEEEPPNEAAVTAFLSSFQPAYDAILADAETQDEIGALYVGLSHPLLGDHTFLGLDAKSEADHWGIGSLSKTFIATLILLYVGDGLLSLNQTIPELLPELDTSAAYGNATLGHVTLHQTLTMMTGVPDFLNDPDGLLSALFENPDQIFTTQDIIDGAVASDPVRPPGQEFLYSSTGYVLLQDIAEDVGGKPAQELYREHIYGILGMSGGDTVLPPRDEQSSIPFPRAEAHDTEGCIEDFKDFGYDPADHGIEEGDTITDSLSPAVNVAGAAGSMYTILDDMLIWTKSGQGNALLTPEMVEKRNDPFAYGMGIYPQGGGYYGHSGEAFGYESFSAHHPETKGSFFVASTSCGAGGMHEDLFRAFVAAVGEAVKAAGDGGSAETESGAPTVSPTVSGTPGGGNGEEGGEENTSNGPTRGILSSVSFILFSAVAHFVLGLFITS